MHINNPVKHFPELIGIPKGTQQEIIDQARYETFTAGVTGSNGKSAWYYFGLLFLVVIIGATLTHFLALNNVILSSMVTVSIYAVAFYWYYKNWIKQVHPKVKEIVKRQSSP